MFVCKKLYYFAKYVKIKYVLHFSDAHVLLNTAKQCAQRKPKTTLFHVIYTDVH